MRGGGVDDGEVVNEFGADIFVEHEQLQDGQWPTTLLISLLLSKLNRLLLTFAVCNKVVPLTWLFSPDIVWTFGIKGDGIKTESLDPSRFWFTLILEFF